MLVFIYFIRITPILWSFCSILVCRKFFKNPIFYVVHFKRPFGNPGIELFGNT